MTVDTVDPVTVSVDLREWWPERADGTLGRPRRVEAALRFERGSDCTDSSSTGAVAFPLPLGGTLVGVESPGRDFVGSGVFLGVTVLFTLLAGCFLGGVTWGLGPGVKDPRRVEVERVDAFVPERVRPPFPEPPVD